MTVSCSCSWLLVACCLSVSPHLCAMRVLLPDRQTRHMLGKDQGDLHKAQQRQEEESESLRGYKFIDLRFERGEVVGFGNERRKQDVLQISFLGMNNDLWDKVRGLASGTWEGCE